MRADECVVYSFEHQAWWMANRCGYTRDITLAGIYSRAEANAIVADAYPGHEIAVLALEAIAWEQRCVKVVGP